MFLAFTSGDFCFTRRGVCPFCNILKKCILLHPCSIWAQYNIVITLQYLESSQHIQGPFVSAGLYGMLCLNSSKHCQKGVGHPRGRMPDRRQV
jgi:hypothetical protein